MLIYHYTRLAGFQGIVSSQQLHASSIRYLNDSTEFLYLFQLLLKDVLPEFVAPDTPLFARLSELSLGHAAFQIARGVFVSCFCGDGDLLSQWRGYGAGASEGVALGFDSDVLNELMQNNYSIPRTDPEDPLSAPDFASDPPTCSLERCVYNRDEQCDSLRRVLGSLDSLGTEEMTLQLVSTVVGLDAARVKHPSFSEENEWRLVFQPGGDTSLIEYRVGRSMLIPFVRIDLSPVFQRALKKVVIGPTLDESASSSSIKGFLEKHGLSYTEVSHSEIPYRETSRGMPNTIVSGGRCPRERGHRPLNSDR